MAIVMAIATTVMLHDKGTPCFVSQDEVGRNITAWWQVLLDLFLKQRGYDIN